MKNNHQPPLVVDLDGTLIFNDILNESLLNLLKNNPLKIFILFVWLLKGIAYLKRQLFFYTTTNINNLPYNFEFINWLKIQKKSGRKLVLCTGSDELIAIEISNYLNLFDSVIASDGKTNLTGQNKANKLVSLYGNLGFDYAGNSNSDIKVWKHSRNIIAVNTSFIVKLKIAKQFSSINFFNYKNNNFSQYIELIRIHQWLKNILLFIPLLASHNINNIEFIGTLIFAFISFSLVASSIYIFNDLFDIDNDRYHPVKKFRPFALGVIPLLNGFILGIILILTSFYFASLINKKFIFIILIYFIITTLYSWKLKKIAIIDCITLALLYTLRIIAGAVALSLLLSFWLLAFSIFFFLSLAFVKRYAELEMLKKQKVAKLYGRAYLSQDASLIQTMGIASGYSSILVLALYLNSDSIQKLYKNPEIVWATVPVILFWISWIWLKAHHGDIHEDPVIFAIKDKASLFVGLLFIFILLIATIGVQW